MPLIDTVERIQGAERDVILFGFTCSDPDHVLSEFLNNPNRFNVAMTRARKKLIVAGSKTFFSAIAHTEKQLQANACFKAFFEHCRENDCCFELASVRFPVFRKQGSGVGDQVNRRISNKECRMSKEGK